MITQQDYDLLLQRCREIPPARGSYLVHDFIENLFLTVLDFQMHNVSVSKAIAYFRDNRFDEVRTLDALKRLLSEYPDDEEGNTGVAQYLWGNRHWTRVSLLRKLIGYFGSMNITTQESLRCWAENSDFKRDFQNRIPGMSYAIYQWLIMRQGIETIKPDTHLIRFVESVVHHSFTEIELVEVLERIARQLELKAYELDWRIWEFQRGQEGTI